MCKYSVAVAIAQATVGTALDIGTVKTTHTPPQTFGAFREKGTTGGCACVKDGTVLTLYGIPPALQQKFDIGPRELVTMIDKKAYAEDQIKINATGKLIPLIQLAGASAYVGVLEDPAAPTETDLGTPAAPTAKPRQTVRA
jgi:hypothetical protein